MSTVNGLSQQDPSLRTSILGTPIFSDLSFNAGAFTNNQGKTVPYSRVVLETLLINASLSKKIVRTEIQGRNGTVKEYIGDDDYVITIQALICGPNGHYPFDEVKQLKNILDHTDVINTIEVVNFFLNQVLGVQNIIITDYSFPQSEGSYSTQAVTINALSAPPIVLQLADV